MTLSVRLPPDLRQHLDSYRKARRLTRTHVVTELLHEHLSGAAKTRKRSYDLASELGLVVGLKHAATDLAENRKQYLTQITKLVLPQSPITQIICLDKP